MTEAWVANLVATGRAAWPTIDVDASEIAAAMRARSGDGAESVAVDLDAAEIYLACACARGDTAALRAFHAAYFAPIAPKLAAMGLDPARRDDLWQMLAERLFVAVGGDVPRIVSYAGRGQLHGLVKVAATRMALDMFERDHRDTSDDWLARVPGAASDPELHWIRQQHRDELKQEVERAIGEMPDRDRAVLRLTIVERVGIDAIATAFRTHRATAARWIASARTRLAELVRARLVERWRISFDELGRLDVIIDSQLDLSLDRLLV